jgi:hypothetical protein
MFLDKIKSGQSGILTYGITPPKSGTPADRMAAIAEKTVTRLTPLDIDALIVYDVQDESARTSIERPFPFMQAHDPFEFASGYLQDLAIPKIIYRPAGKFSAGELTDWLEDLHKHRFYPVFVGLPAPDHPVKTSLPDAYKIWSKHKDASVIGAVTIPERHQVLKDEDKRILEKAGCGVSYFISQCVFNVAYAKRMIADLEQSCIEKKAQFPTVIFTLTVCGSLKTLSFMEWLGIHMPEDLKQDFRMSPNMLERSIQVCLDIASELTLFCSGRSIPFGFNIESVAIKSDEIDASVYLVNEIAGLLYHCGIRKQTIASSPLYVDKGEGAAGFMVATDNGKEKINDHQRKTGTA